MWYNMETTDTTANSSSQQVWVYPVGTATTTFWDRTDSVRIAELEKSLAEVKQTIAKLEEAVKAIEEMTDHFGRHMAAIRDILTRLSDAGYMEEEAT